MKSRKNKLLIGVLACTMAFGMVFGAGCGGSESKSESTLHNEFIDSIGGVSETYVGTVSDEAYETANEAAKAYVQNEVVGEADATIISATTKGTLTEQEVTALNLPEDIQDGIQEIEKLEVEYSLNKIATMDTLNTNKTVIVYVIKYEDDFKYYSPLPVTGSTITKSYYDSVFNAEKYKNCTYSWDMDMSYDMTIPNYGDMTMDLSMKQLVKYDNGKIYLEQTTSMTSPEGAVPLNTIYAYMETVDGQPVCYVKMGSESTEWNPSDLHTIGFDSLEELTPFYDQYLDYTYFTKSEFGFEISGENMDKYLQQTFELADLSAYAGMMDVDLILKFYVKDGSLSGMREDGSINMNVTQNGQTLKMKAKIKAIGSVTNYGTTVVEKPFTE